MGYKKLPVHRKLNLFNSFSALNHAGKDTNHSGRQIVSWLSAVETKRSVRFAAIASHAV